MATSPPPTANDGELESSVRASAISEAELAEHHQEVEAALTSSALLPDQRASFHVILS